jgi:hypothetical protein
MLFCVKIKPKWDWDVAMVEGILSMHEALDSIPSTEMKQKQTNKHLSNDE